MLAGQNIVIVAKQLQPGQIGEYFLIKNEIVKNGGIYGPKISTDQFASFTTANFDLLATPDKVTFNIHMNALIPDVIESIKKFVNALPALRINAIGMNLAYRLTDDPQGIGQWTRERFALKESCDELSNDDTIWGSIAWSHAHGGMMRLQISPGFENEDQMELGPTTVLAEFNYHFKIESVETDKESAIIVLGKFNEIANHACSIQAKFVKK